MRASVVATTLALLLVAAGALPRDRKWRGVDWTKAEKDLEEGDDPELLVSEDKIAIKEYDRRRGLGLQKPEDDVQLKSSDEWLRHSQAMTGPAMMFVTLKTAQADGTYWSKRAVEKLAGQWRDLVKTAGLDAQVYDISHEGGAPQSETFTLTPTPSAPLPTIEPTGARLLVSMHNGWRGYDLRDFVLRRPEVAEVEWDQVKFTPADLDEDGNFIGGTTSDKAGTPDALKNLPGFAMSPDAPAAKRAAAEAAAKSAKAKAKLAAAAAKKAREEEEEDAIDWAEDKKEL